MNGNQEHLQVFLAEESPTYIVEFFLFIPQTSKRTFFLTTQKKWGMTSAHEYHIYYNYRIILYYCL